MNDRIKELSKQANDYVNANDPLQPDHVTWNEQYDQKFAELIVRECMDNLAWHGHDEAVSQLDWFLHNKIRS